MWEKVIPFAETCQCYGVNLHAVWDVEADEFYDICWPQQKEDKVFPGSIAMCYTLKGEGRLELANKSSVAAHENSVIFCACEQISRYFCTGSAWRFHWIEFSLYGPFPLPMHESIEVPLHDTYTQCFYELTYAICQNTPAYRRLAAATFTKLIYDWGSLCEDRNAQSPLLSSIQAVIGEMHKRISENWPVPSMAQMANMSEPSFRQAFRSLTGQSPKKFYSSIRMAMAENLLRKNTATILEIADQLGYSDAFHLSKEFKKYFGYPPSDLKRKIK